MADFTEPTIAEDVATLTGTATWPFTNTNGYTFDNTQFAAGSITLINAGLPGVCTFPLFIPPTFTGWLTSAETVTGAADVEISTPYEPTWQDLPATMTTISERGDEASLRVNLAAGANSLDSLVITYSMSFASIADIDYFTSIDDEVTSGKVFSATDKRTAIRFANARVLYLLKDWTEFYTERLNVQVRKLLVEAEAYLSIAILYETKARQMLNLIDHDNFSVGDLSVSPAPGAQKELYGIYLDNASLYTAKANSIIAMVIPPGSDSIRSTFYFDVCDSQSQVDREILYNLGGINDDE